MLQYRFILVKEMALCREGWQYIMTLEVENSIQGGSYADQGKWDPDELRMVRKEGG